MTLLQYRYEKRNLWCFCYTTVMSYLFQVYSVLLLRSQFDGKPYNLQAPTPQTDCRACSDSQTAFIYPLGSAFGRRLLQQLPRLKCCSQPPSGSALCGTSECTIVLAAGVVGILVAAVMGIAVLIVIRCISGF